MTNEEYEQLIKRLNDPEFFEQYKKPFDDYKVGIVPKILGKMLVFSGNLVYGRKPTYRKFKAVEVIARIPYQSWEVASYMLLTAMYSNEKKAIELSKVSEFSREAQDNETMHVVVLSQIVKRVHTNNFILHTLIPLLFSFFYFAAVFILYLFSNKAALELNYMFESHAFEQYDRFLKENEEKLRAQKVDSKFLRFYGRDVSNEYDLFRSICNDEIVHRNKSIEKVYENEEHRKEYPKS